VSRVRRKVSAAARPTSRRKEPLRWAKRSLIARRRTPGRSGAPSAGEAAAAAAAGEGGGVSRSLAGGEAARARSSTSIFGPAARDSRGRGGLVGEGGCSVAEHDRDVLL
jgi:hypothetical protein